MNLQSYLIECVLNDKDLVDVLLEIDNKIQYTDLSYENVLDILKNINVYDNLNDTCIAITDGEVDTVIRVLLQTSNLTNLFINRSFLGINKYFVKCVNDYYEKDKIQLDTSTDYRKYIDSSNKIVLAGFDTFVEELSKEFENRDLIIL